MTAPVDSSRLAPYRAAIADLPDGELGRDVLLDGRFRIYRSPQFDVHYAPFDHINLAAKVALVGITPGWHQMRLAFEAARDGIRAGKSDDEVLWVVKQHASFAGMRERLVAWLNDLGVAGALGVGSTDALFGGRAELLHTTSAVRYPVICPGRKNWSGVEPDITEPVFRRFIARALAPELDAVGQALIIPLGVAVERALRVLVADGSLSDERCLFGFPHPSGQNTSGPARFKEARPKLAAIVGQWRGMLAGGA
jgi:hypothetical protein